MHATRMSETLRYSLSFTLVVAVHAGAALLALIWVQLPEPPGAPPAAMMIDLAPLAAAPASTPTELPPAPAPMEAPPPPPEAPPPLPPEQTPMPEPLPAPEPPPPVQKPVEDVVAEPQPELSPPVQESAAPPPAPLVAEQATAPQSGVSALPPADALPGWQGLLLGHLERHKRYPREAQWRRQEGVVYVYFTMDRQGNVLNYKLEKSSGFSTLDNEVLALIERAQPLPAPPAELTGEILELVVPVQFFMRQH